MAAKRVLGVIADDIPMSSIELPDNLQRQTLKDEDVVSLAESIRSVGLINPISVIPSGDNYKLVAGYRRYCAHIKIGAETIRANIFANARESADAVTLAENLERADINPVDEADWILRLATADNLTQEQIARRLKRSQSFVRERLSVARLGDDLREAIRGGLIPLGVAMVIDGCKDAEERRSILTTVINHGASEAVVRQWVATANAQADSRRMTAESGEPQLPAAPMQYEAPRVVCEFCGEACDYQSSRFVRTCGDCYQLAKHNLQQRAE